MTQAFEKTARAREIELIQTRLAVLSVLESTLETNCAALHGLRAAILQLGSRGHPWQSKIGRASYRSSAVPSAIKVVYPGLTKSPWSS
jgi:hypothetical protein